MSQLSEKQKYEIIVKHEMGISNTAISNDMNISRVTVAHWLKRYENTNSINRKIGSGRKKSIESKFMTKLDQL